MKEEKDIEKYIEWVVNKIDLVQEYGKAINKPDVSIYDLKSILSERLRVTLILGSEYQRFKKSFRVLKTEFDIFWDEKYTLTRRTLNPTTLSSGKWASKSDIESEVRFQYKEEYLKFKKELDELEDRISFLKRLMSSWDSISFDVSNYIKLIEIEVYSLNNSSSTEISNKQRRVRTN